MNCKYTGKLYISGVRRYHPADERHRGSTPRDQALARRIMASESEQLAYLREHQPALETVLVKAVGATVSARSDDPVHFLVTYLAEAVGLVVRSRPSKRLREIGFKAMAIGATVREVVGLRQWIPESSAGIQDDAGGLDPIFPEQFQSLFPLLIRDYL